MKIKSKEWLEVLRLCSDFPDQMFILRSLASTQHVSYHIIFAFNDKMLGHLEGELKKQFIGDNANLIIGRITKKISSVTGRKTTATNNPWYLWNLSQSSWMISWENYETINQAFKKFSVIKTTN